MAQVVTQLALLRSAARERKDDHVRATNMQGTRAKTYFIVYSSHPQNKRTLHVTGTLELDTPKQRIYDGCCLHFYKGAEKLTEKDYAMADFLKVVEDALVYMDAGEIRPSLATTTKRKGAI